MHSPHQRDSTGTESNSLATAVAKSKPLIFSTLWNNACSTLDLLAFGVSSPLLVFYVPRTTRTRQGRGIRSCEKGGEFLQAAAKLMLLGAGDLQGCPAPLLLCCPWFGALSSAVVHPSPCLEGQADTQRVFPEKG